MDAHDTSVPRYNLSMGEYLRRRYDRTQRPLSCNALDEPGWRSWRARFSAQLYALMGPWPEPVPLDPMLLDRVECDGYSREKVLFASEREMAVSAYVLHPAAYDPARRYPAVICQHGHGFGKDDVAGLAHGTYPQWTWIQRLHYAYGVEFCRKGYLVLAMDARGFGERALGYPSSPGEHGCNLVQMKAQLLGLNLLTLNTFDVLRCVDYLETRPDVDPKRIACAGLSTGGTLTLFAAALDQRIRVAIVSGAITSLQEQTFVRGDTCGSQIVPGLSCWAELADVACLIAPRPLLIESGTADPMFGIEAALEAYGAVHRLYAVLGEPERAVQHVFEGDHRWDGALCGEWLERWL